MEAMDGTNCPQCATEEPRANARKAWPDDLNMLTKDSAPGRLPEIVASLRDEYRPETTPRFQDRCARLFQELSRELQPAGVAEQLLVADMARCAANVELHAVAATVWRQWATNAMAEFAAGCGSVLPFPDLPIRGLPSGVANREEQQVFVHSRAFHLALQLYLKLRKTPAAHRPSLKTCEHFEDEEACQQYLAQYQLRNFACANCGARKAYYITMRRCLECASCHTQIGLRDNTVIANSPLPLATWFLAISLFLREPTVSASRAGLLLGLNRVATARIVIHKIQQALLSDQHRQLLAGLDEYYGEPESSVSYLSQASLATKRTRASAASDYPLIGPAVAPTAVQPTGSSNLSYVVRFITLCDTDEKEKTMSDTLPQNLPGPEPDQAAEPQPESQSKPQSKTKRRCHSVEECLALLSQLPLLLASRLITPSVANAMRSTLHEILAHHQRSVGPQGGPAVDDRLLQFLRTNPDFANSLAPFLTTEQADQLLREAANGNDKG